MLHIPAGVSTLERELNNGHRTLYDVVFSLWVLSMMRGKEAGEEV